MSGKLLGCLGANFSGEVDWGGCLRHGVHLPPSGNVVKCFVHYKTLSRRIIYRLHYFHNLSLAYGALHSVEATFI